MRVVQAFAADDHEFENFQRQLGCAKKSLEAIKIAAVRQPMINFACSRSSPCWRTAGTR